MKRGQRVVLVERVNLLWYPATLLPILGLGYAVLQNWLPFWFGMIAVFLFLFWVSSLGFAIVSLLRRRPPAESRP